MLVSSKIYLTVLLLKFYQLHVWRTHMSAKVINNITVAKFGGTSVADYQAMLRCADIIKNNTVNRVVVVSASAGVTNHLVRLSQADVPSEEREQIISNIADIQYAITQHFIKPDAINSEISALLISLRTC